MIPLKGKRIIITGATGFIGRNTAALLLEEGAQIYALVRPERMWDMGMHFSTLPGAA